MMDINHFGPLICSRELKTLIRKNADEINAEKQVVTWKIRGSSKERMTRKVAPFASMEGSKQSGPRKKSGLTLLQLGVTQFKPEIFQCTNIVERNQWIGNRTA